MRSGPPRNPPFSLLKMKAFFQHPATLVTLAFLLLIGAWSVIITTAVRHRAESVPIPAQVEADDQNS